MTDRLRSTPRGARLSKDCGKITHPLDTRQLGDRLIPARDYNFLACLNSGE
ncbi:MAG: hypothetical protein JO136_23400, partial [Hyphomicrobiales bacterium]|nr:hypothetical protein [Hyphomicrobiales bacterium]